MVYGEIHSAVQEMLKKRADETDPDQDYGDSHEHVVSWEDGESIVLEKTIKSSGLANEPLALLDYLAIEVFKAQA